MACKKLTLQEYLSRPNPDPRPTAYDTLEECQNSSECCEDADFNVSFVASGASGNDNPNCNGTYCFAGLTHFEADRNGRPGYYRLWNNINSPGWWMMQIIRSSEAEWVISYGTVGVLFGQNGTGYIVSTYTTDPGPCGYPTGSRYSWFTNDAEAGDAPEDFWGPAVELGPPC